jgi:hypothetical protein
MPRAEIPTEERCTALTKAGTPCKLRGKVLEGREARLCGTHAKPQPPQCTIVTRGVQCVHRVVAGSQTECSYHRLSRERRERWQLWRNARERIRDIYLERLGDHPVRYNHFFETVLSTYIIQAVNHRIHVQPTQTDNEAVDAFPLPAIIDLVAIVDARVAENAARMAEWRARQNQHAHLPELGRMAHDSQNVHTTAVTEQTNKNMEILLAITDIPVAQATLYEIKQAWDKIYVSVKVDNRIYEDMKKWWNQTSCTQQNDYLYRRLLRRLWFKIKSTENEETRTELTKRLQQECAEAFGLCCAGHINRLCNVLVGFDERFVQEFKKGDTTILQNRFAQIAQIEDDVEKYRQATGVIAELGLTTEEAAPWLDSLA